MYKAVALIFLGVLIALAGQYCLKVGMNQVGEIKFWGEPVAALVKIFMNWTILGGLFLYFISAIIWMIVLSWVDLSFAYPFIGINYILVLLVSRFVLHEQVGAFRWTGSAIIFLGICVVALEKQLEKVFK